MSLKKRIQASRMQRVRTHIGLNRKKGLSGKKAEASPTPTLDELSKKYFDESLLTHGE
ncbi:MULTISPECIES: hypothetical protein [Streptomyces]|uniref:hypothetical protein n=1 Tax=Streptomyces TaxID=1883 RepID=UPI0029A0D25A|nr:hypothetical protein [Streptomyces stelliscabiei]MDX2610981.1 hypothetical protein [Streptomyces stelliscabiei]